MIINDGVYKPLTKSMQTTIIDLGENSVKFNPWNYYNTIIKKKKKTIENLGFSSI